VIATGSAARTGNTAGFSFFLAFDVLLFGKLKSKPATPDVNDQTVRPVPALLV